MEIVTLSGSVEIAPALGLAAAIVELPPPAAPYCCTTSCPSTPSSNWKRCSRAILPRWRDETKGAQIERLLMRLRASIAARQYRYIMMNAPRAALDRIVQITPGLKSPTVVPLLDPEWVAVHTVIRETSSGTSSSVCARRARRRYWSPR